MNSISATSRRFHCPMGIVVILGAAAPAFAQESIPNYSSVPGMLGYSSAVVGDLDADGTPEIALGGPYASDGAGVVHIVSGSSGDIIRTLAAPPDSQGFGTSLATVTDVNGDGNRELLVGAFPATKQVRAGLPPSDQGPEASYAGGAYVYSPSSGDRIYSVTIEERKIGFGFSAAAFVDVNSDGVEDYLVTSAQGYSSERKSRDCGALYLVDGSNGELLQQTLPTEPMVAGYGHSVDVIGDLNGDGFPEVCVASFASRHGGGYSIYSGVDMELLHTKKLEVAGGDTSGVSCVEGWLNLNGDQIPDFCCGIVSVLDGVRHYRVAAYSGSDLSELWEYSSFDSHGPGFTTSIKALQPFHPDFSTDHSNLVVTSSSSKQNRELKHLSHTGQLVENIPTQNTPLESMFAPGVAFATQEHLGQECLVIFGIVPSSSALDSRCVSVTMGTANWEVQASVDI